MRLVSANVPAREPADNNMWYKARARACRLIIIIIVNARTFHGIRLESNPRANDTVTAVFVQTAVYSIRAAWGFSRLRGEIIIIRL